MTTLIAVLLPLSLCANAWQWFFRPRGLRAALEMVGLQCATLRGERDGLHAGLKYMPMTPAELMRLAKTGCPSCHGAGKDSQVTLCRCAEKNMSADPVRYVCAGGVAARLATREEREKLLGQKFRDDPKAIHGVRFDGPTDLAEALAKQDGVSSDNMVNLSDAKVKGSA